MSCHKSYLQIFITLGRTIFISYLHKTIFRVFKKGFFLGGGLILLHIFRFRHFIFYTSLPVSGFKWHSCNTNSPPQAPVQYNNAWQVPELDSMRSRALRSPTQRSQLILLQASPPNSINLTVCHSHGALALCAVFRLYVYLLSCPFGRRYAAVRFLGLRARIPPVSCMFVSCECCTMSGRGLCDGLITRPEESYRVCVRTRAIKCDQVQN
jgi:hypothetical protein